MTSGGIAVQLIKLPNILVKLVESFIGGKPYMLALAGQPSLHGYSACCLLE